MLFWQIYFRLIMVLPVTAATDFTVATFNVKNYLLSPHETRKKKADALQKMWRKVAFDELRNRLSKRRLEYRHHLWLEGPDPAIHLALVSSSRFWATIQKPMLFTIYLLDRKRFQVSRSFRWLALRVIKNTFTLINARLNLKGRSQWQIRLKCVLKRPEHCRI